MSIILCSLLSVGIFKLLLSSSFLASEPGLYALLGFAIMTIKERRSTCPIALKEKVVKEKLIYYKCSAKKDILLKNRDKN